MSPVRLKLARYPLQPEMNCGEASWALRTPETEGQQQGQARAIQTYESRRRHEVLD